MLYSVELRGHKGGKNNKNLLKESFIILQESEGMRIIFCSVGKQNEKYVDEGVKIFTKRISYYYPVEWKFLPPAKNPADEMDQRRRESSAILSILQPGDVTVVLDEKGKQFTSPELADFIQQQAINSVKRIVFVIGGAYGVSSELLAAANIKWSLSKLVFPHQLVRLLLAEQAYRACTIIKNEKYHHS